MKVMLENKFVLHANSVTNEDNLISMKNEKSVSLMIQQGLQSEWLDKAVTYPREGDKSIFFAKCHSLIPVLMEVKDAKSCTYAARLGKMGQKNQHILFFALFLKVFIYVLFGCTSFSILVVACRPFVVAHRSFRWVMYTYSCVLWDRGPWPGIKCGPLHWEILSHWTIREVPILCSL